MKRWCFLFFCSGSLAAGTFSQPVSLWLEEYATERFSVGEVSADISQRRGGVEIRGETFSWGWYHDYRAFGFPEDAASNGHVHRTGPFFAWSSEAWRAAFYPVLAVSSNVLKQQKDLSARDVLPGGEILRLHQTPGGTWRWGARADSRTGRFQILPVLAWQSEGDRRLRGTLGFPDSQLHWQPRSDWVMGADVGPDGGVWRVRDRNFERVSTLREQRWRGRLFMEWAASPHVHLGAAWEHAVQRKWEYTLEDGNNTQILPPDASLFLFSIRIGF